MECAHETLDKTRHNTRKGPTAPMRRGKPSGAKTMTDMETPNIEIQKGKNIMFHHQICELLIVIPFYDQIELFTLHGVFHML